MSLLFRIQCRFAVREEARALSYSRAQIRAKLDELTDEKLQEAITQSGVELPPELTAVTGPVGAIGDGKILKAIRDFLKTENGQMLIKFILSLLFVI